MIDQRSPEWRLWMKIVARAWAEPDFRKRLLADPAGVLQEHGIQVPPGIQLRVVENTGMVRHLILPEQPSDEISEAELEQIAAGRTASIHVVCDTERR